MSSAKKTKPSSRRPASAPAGRSRGWLLALLIIAGAFAAAWYGAWQYVRGRVLSSEEFWVTYDKVDITPLPEWIHSDIRAQVFRDASLDRPLSIADDDLVERVRGAFALHPWVAKVERVQKFHPARVQVEVVYRRPVCMVEVGDEPIPVDADGVALPREDFSPQEASRYPHLAGVESAPLGIAGTRWSDDRVLGGAEIAAALTEAWEKMGLSRIIVQKPPGSATSGRGFVVGLHDTPSFDLLTRNGTTIHWGRGPSGDAPGEIPVKEKVARLEQYLAEHGNLDSQPGGVGLDLSRPATPEPSGASKSLVPLQGPHRSR